MSGIVDERPVGIVRLMSKSPQRLCETIAVKVGDLGDVEAILLYRVSNQLRVVGGVREMGDVLVRPVADDQGDPSLCLSGRCDQDVRPIGIW